MIVDSRGWWRAKETIRKHKSRMDLLHRRYADARVARAAAIEIEQLQRRVKELEHQIIKYDSLMQRTADVKGPASLMELPETLVARRIRCGMLQCELAGQLGVHPKTMSRYEATNFASANFRLLVRIDAILRQVEVKTLG